MKVFSKISVFTVLIIVIAILINYSICPIYDYPPEIKFSGDRFYNPYSDIAAKEKIKANFHAHSKVWLGLTNGKKNIKEEMVQRYKFLNYNFVGISDYQSINTYQQNDQLYIPEYEHGYGLKKNHQLSLGAKRVLWNDYPLFQTIDNKQNILKELKSLSEIVIIAHPMLRNAYDAEDFIKLTDYDGIEILNNESGKSVNLWDAALSSGHRVIGIGDDDSHHSENPNDMGCCFNIIFCDSMNETGVIKSLKAGKIYAVEQHGETMELKRKKALDIPSLLSLNIDSGKIVLKIERTAKVIDFIGQNGNLKERQYETSTGSYKLKPEDSYIRTEITFQDSTLFYLNPVFRYSRENQYNISATINWSKTWILRLISGIIFLTIIFTFRHFKNKGQNKKSSYAKIT